MQIYLSTIVSGNYKEVMKQFDRKLFEALTPDDRVMELIEFTGSKEGDWVHLRFKLPFRADWKSEITEDGMDEEKAWFVDEGRVLPFGLGYWKHKHIVEKMDDNSSRIIDDIEYKAQNSLLTLLIYPVLFAAFYPRKRAYRKYFGKG